MGGGLCSAFLDGHPHPEPQRLEALLQAMEAAGRAAHDGVAYRAEEFARDLGRLRLDGDPVEALPALHAADLFLALACARGDARALALFETRHLAPLAARLGTDGSEVVAALREALLLPSAGRPPQIAGYSGRGPLSGWLRAVAVHAAHKQRRRAGAEQRRAEAAVEDVVADPELEFLKRRDRPRFQEAFRAALAALPPRERTLLRLHYAEGLPAENLAALHRVHRATATRWIAQARALLLDELRGRLVADLRLDRPEIESLVRLLRSQLELSLRQALGG